VHDRQLSHLPYAFSLQILPLFRLILAGLDFSLVVGASLLFSA
jgi:hypothetical protein